MKKSGIILLLIFIGSIAASQNINHKSIKINKMDNKDKVSGETQMVVEKFYKYLLSDEKGKVIDLMADDILWNIPGNKQLAPWVGKRSGKEEVAEFFSLQKQYIEHKGFGVNNIFIDGEHAIAVGNLSSFMLQSNRLYNSPFSAHFTVKNNLIVDYLFLENEAKLIEVLSNDEQKKELIKKYFIAVDNKDITKTLSLFDKDIEAFFPQYGTIKGLENFQKLNDYLSNIFKDLTHDIDNFRYTLSNDKIIVEGTESGTLSNGKTFEKNRFCSVFEIQNSLITRMYIYTDSSFIN